MKQTLFATLTLALLTGGCSSPISPERTAGVFVLESIDGARLPIIESSDGRRSTLYADTVVLRDDRSGEWVRSTRTELTGWADSSVRVLREEFTYVTNKSGFHIVQDFTIPPGLENMQIDWAIVHRSARLINDGFALTEQWQGNSATVKLYRRVE